MLNQVLDGRYVNQNDILEIYEFSKNNPTELFKASSILRKKHKGDIVTFSKKAFFNIVNLCTDTCSYCTYKAEPGENKL